MSSPTIGYPRGQGPRSYDSIPAEGYGIAFPSPETPTKGEPEFLARIRGLRQEIESIQDARKSATLKLDFQVQLVEELRALLDLLDRHERALTGIVDSFQEALQGTEKSRY